MRPGYSEALLDERLHHLSKWHCNYAGFQRFVRLTVAPLKIKANEPFHFLELGVRLALGCTCSQTLMPPLFNSGGSRRVRPRASPRLPLLHHDWNRPLAQSHRHSRSCPARQPIKSVRRRHGRAARLSRPLRPHLVSGLAVLPPLSLCRSLRSRWLHAQPAPLGRLLRQHAAR